MTETSSKNTDLIEGFVGRIIESSANVATQVAQFAEREANRIQTYRFKALPQEVDIRRIVSENKNAEFLIIQFSRTITVHGKSKKQRPENGFLLFINKEVLDMFNPCNTPPTIAGEELNYHWGYRWMYHLILTDDLVFDTDEDFRGRYVNPTETGTVLKQIAEVKKRLKELKSANAPAVTGKKKYTKEEKKKLVDVTVKVL